MFVVEGYREISLALQGGYRLTTVLFQPDILTEERVTALLKGAGTDTEVIRLSGEVYERLAYRSTTEGILAMGKVRENALSGLSFARPDPLILVAEAPEKPGNIGALLRTADAAGLDAVLIANPKTDLYNPNIIRSSLGCVFTTPVATGKTPEILAFLKERDIAVYCAALTASVPYHTVDFKPAAAIVVGTEDEGLGDIWLHNATENILIPMQGVIDSMNVSAAAAVLIFEAKRQRGFSS